MATQGNENALYFVNNFSLPVACQSAAGQAKIFPQKLRHAYYDAKVSYTKFFSSWLRRLSSNNRF